MRHSQDSATQPQATTPPAVKFDPDAVNARLAARAVEADARDAAYKAAHKAARLRGDLVEDATGHFVPRDAEAAARLEAAGLNGLNGNGKHRPARRVRKAARAAEATPASPEPAEAAKGPEKAFREASLAARLPQDAPIRHLTPASTLEEQQAAFLQALLHGLPDGWEMALAQAVGPADDPKFPASRLDLDRVPLAGAWYYACGALESTGRKVKRRKAGTVGVRAIVCDDIGTKIDAAKFANCPPSYIIETSPGNHQFGYLIAWDEDTAAHEALNEALIKAEMTDPGATGITRLSRIPGSLHRNPKHGGFQSRLVLDYSTVIPGYNPTGLRQRTAPWRVFFNVGCVASHLKLRMGDYDGRRAKHKALLETPPDGSLKDPVYKWLADQGCVESAATDGWMNVLCPFAEEHTKEGNTAKYLPRFRAHTKHRGVECHHSHGYDKDAYAARFYEAMKAEGGPDIDVVKAEEQAEATAPLHELARKLHEAKKAKQAEAEARLPLQRDHVSLVDPRDLLQATDEPPFLIDGFLEAGALGMLWGPPEVFKSFIALDWSLCIAHGLPWHGQPVRKGAVIYIAGEGRRGMAKRVQGWMTENGVKTLENFYPSKGGVNARDPNFAIDLLSICEHTGPPVLIVLDTLHRNFGGGDENQAKDVGELLDVIDRQIGQTTGATVLIVHHATKEGGAYRGSSALKGGVDVEYEVVRNGEALACELICRKMKDAPRAPTLAISLEVVDQRMAAFAKTATSIAKAKKERKAS